MLSKKILKMAGISVFFLLVIIYALFSSRDLIFGVKIKNVTLDSLPAQSGATFIKSVLSVAGNAKNAVKLTLNGREITIDQQSNFNEVIALLPGYNIMNIKAQDQFGYIDEKNFYLIGQFTETNLPKVQEEKLQVIN